MTKTSYNRILIGGAVAAVLIVGAIFVFKSGDSSSSASSRSLEGRTEVGWDASGEGGVPSSSEIGTAEIAHIQPSDFTKTYQNKKYGFSFRYPEGYTVTNVPDDGTGGSILLIQDKAGKAGVQISISPFDEPNAILTPNRVEQEAGITVESPQDVLVGESGKGLAFIGKGTDFGTSREVWFVFGRTLYQISTYIELDELLKNILRTWKFE